MYHVNEKYLIDGKIPNMTEAMKKSGNASDTFAVLAILVNLQQPENSDVTKLFDSFTHVKLKAKITSLANSFHYHICYREIRKVFTDIMVLCHFPIVEKWQFGLYSRYNLIIKSRKKIGT